LFQLLLQVISNKLAELSHEMEISQEHSRLDASNEENITICGCATLQPWIPKNLSLDSLLVRDNTSYDEENTHFYYYHLPE
jgi:hypothetical protein